MIIIRMQMNPICIYANARPVNGHVSSVTDAHIQITRNCIIRPPCPSFDDLAFDHVMV